MSTSNRRWLAELWAKDQDKPGMRQPTADEKAAANELEDLWDILRECEVYLHTLPRPIQVAIQRYHDTAKDFRDPDAADKRCAHIDSFGTRCYLDADHEGPCR